jgi:hypothetical protein
MQKMLSMKAAISKYIRALQLSPLSAGMFHGPKWMPETLESTKPYVYSATYL